MAGPKLEARLGLDTKEFDSKLKGADQGIADFGKELMTTAGAMAAAAAAAAALFGAFKETSQGVDTLNVLSKVYKQTLYDIITAQGSMGAFAIQNAIEENRLRAKNLFDLLEIADVQRSIARLRLDAADQTKSEYEQLKSLRAAYEEQNRLMQIRIENTKEELRLAYREWQTQKDSEKAREKLITLSVELKNIETDRYVEGRRLLTQITNLEAKQAQDQKDALERIKELGKAYKQALEEDAANAIKKAREEFLKLKEDTYNWASTLTRGVNVPMLSGGEPVVGGGMARGGKDLAGAPTGPTEAINEMTAALQMQQEAVAILSDGFYDLFTGAEDGLKNMVESVLQGIARVVAELAAKAAILGLITLIFPGTALAGRALTGLKTMFTGFNGGGGMSVGTIGSTVGSQSLVAAVKGDQLQLILNRQ